MNYALCIVVFGFLLSYPYKTVETLSPIPIREEVGVDVQVVAQLSVYLPYSIVGLDFGLLYNFESSASLIWISAPIF